MEDRTENIRMARRTYSRVGLSIVVMFLLDFVLGTALQIALLPERPEDLSYLTAALCYVVPSCVATPLGYFLVMRPMPSSPPEVHGITPGQFAQLPFIGFFMQGSMNLVTLLLLALAGVLIGLLTGGGTETPVEAPTAALFVELPLSLNFLYSVIVGPILEELVCRKAVIDRIRPYGEKLALVSSAILFGLFHHNLQQLFYTAALGLLFGYVYLRTGRLWYSIALHIINNLGAFLVQDVLVRRDAAALVSSGGPGDSVVAVFGIVLLTVCVLGLIFLIRGAKRVWFAPAERELPPKGRARIAWLNVGMILCVIFGLLFGFAQMIF